MSTIQASTHTRTHTHTLYSHPQPRMMTNNIHGPEKKFGLQKAGRLPYILGIFLHDGLDWSLSTIYLHIKMESQFHFMWP